ncbi:hypothetical protein [uncultured Bifidobacterium sp.]|uniref:hypothetical protein n=1 Tax=uncultured Bifidobacterium sp. TaxID=165187 RepID=UPI002598ECF0|nr:hypothetical protein [uncultured Bifidobacterium sp.]
MTVIEAVAAIVAVVIIPFLVNAIKTNAMTGNVARWVAMIVSVIGGIIVGLIGGVPTTPEAWLTTVFAIVGGVQFAYSAFKSVGITNAWLEALLNVNTGDVDAGQTEDAD